MLKTLFCFSISILFLSTSLAQADDPYIWLEEVESEESMDWVLAQNKLTKDKFEQTPEFSNLFENYKTVYSDKDKIAYPSVVGDYVYNFWQDDEHVRGIWRRTGKANYDGNKDEWEIVLDLDKLSETEGKKWVFHGSRILRPSLDRCLLMLSDGGTDENEVREFDLVNKKFVEDGFALPSSKGSVAWISENEILIARNFGEGTMTTSGYPRMVKKWSRGTSLESAELIYECSEKFMGCWGFSEYIDEKYYYGVSAYETFYSHSTHYMKGKELKEIQLQKDVELSAVFKGQLILTLQSDWQVGVKTFPMGSVVSVGLQDVLVDKINPIEIYAPDERSSVNSIASSQDYLILNTYHNVQSKVLISTFDGKAWSNKKFEAKDFGSVSIINTNSKMAGFYYTYSNFITPPTLYFSDGTKSREIKKQKARFNTEGLVVNYHESKSTDGTMIPYFIVHKKDIKMDGTNPTLVYAYGGFNISQRPSYKTEPGIGWLENGGIYVVACIRGGGEFGPSWHKAAMKEKRQNAYNDFYSVCEDLIDKKITSPKHLGAFGWSNGGLMAGVVATQRPDLFNAVIIGAPLLDMKRFSHMLAGASWMGEYGDPDSDDWKYIQLYSPYHNVNQDMEYPEVLFMTSTKDDRVHPAHARKMAALMNEQGHPLFYYETVEGGHGASSTIEQSAFNSALMYTYLSYKLK